VPGLFEFETHEADGLLWYVLSAGDEDTGKPCWPGLWEMPFEVDSRVNPFWRFGINNEDGEILALWRAFAWELTGPALRIALPRYDRDHVAAYLGLEKTELTFVRWEYEVNYESFPFPAANGGFVPARSCIPIRPAPTEWELQHKDLAALIVVGSLNVLNRIDNGLSFDVASEMSLIGATEADLVGLQDSLSTSERPELREILGSRGVLVHLTIVRDRFLGHHSYLAVTSRRDLSSQIDSLNRDFAARWARYQDRVPQLASFQDFCDAVDEMLTPPGSARGEILPWPSP
jgi:hypothetical protein